MKKSVKAALLSLCAVLLVATTMFATLAYLQATSYTLTNTFTVGDVSIVLQEQATDAYGTPTSGYVGTSDNGGNAYKLVPGHTYTKDPTITVASGSEPCYLYVKFTNGIDAVDGTSISDQMSTNHWVLVTGYTDLYMYSEDGTTPTSVNASASAVNKEVFHSFTLDNTNLSGYGSATITVTAFAIQVDGVNASAAATAAATALSATAAA